MAHRARGTRSPTAWDVARLAGVSQAAVSRAFSQTASIAPQTRALVLEAAAELGYRPNLIARSLITDRSHLIGVAMAYLDNQFNPLALQHLCEGLRARGYQTLLHASPLSADSEPTLQAVLHYRVDALVLASTGLSSQLAAQCAQAGVPVVLFNRTVDAASVSSVTGDNFAGARSIGAFLAAGGHRRVGFVAGLESTSTNRDREAGLRAGLAAAGLSVAARAVGNYDAAQAAEATRQLLRRDDRPDALVFANDHMAIAGMQVARYELGLAVPGDVSVVGFDDVGPAHWPAFDLTTYAQPLLPMVEATLALIDEALRPEPVPPRHVVVPGALIVRGSARRPGFGLVESATVTIWQP